MKRDQITSLVAVVGDVSLIAAVFVLDLLTPTGFPVWFFYLIPILLLSLRLSGTFLFSVVGFCSLLTLFGLRDSLTDPLFDFVLTVRSSGIVLFFLVAVFLSPTPRREMPRTQQQDVLNQRMVTSLAGAFLMVVLLVTAAYQATRLYEESEQVLFHSRKAFDEVNAIHALFTVAESEQRSFLLTGQESYLKPYHQALDQLGYHLKTLRTLPQGSPLQRDQFDNLEGKVAKKVAELSAAIATRRTGRHPTGIQVQDTATMEDIHAVIAQLQNVEQSRIHEQMRLSSIMFRVLLSHLGLGGLLQIGFLSAAGVFLWQTKVAAQVQAKSEAAMREALGMLNATSDGAFIFDLRTLQFRYVNEGAERQVGYTRQELLCMTPLHIAPEFDETRFRAMIDEVASEKGAGRRFTTVHRHKNGTDTPVEINLQFVGSGMDGARLIAISRDITERKKTEQVLRESEERFRTLANNIPQLAWMANEEGQIFWHNQRWLEYCGLTLDDMAGGGWEKVHHPAHLERVLKGIRKCYQTGEVWEDMFPLRSRDGTYGWFLSMAIPVRNEQGRVYRWLGTSTDVTEQRENEENLQRNREQLEASNRELDAFAYSVSHDLRAPLRSIDGFSQALLEDCKGSLNEQGIDYLCRIRAASQRMGQLIDDLLNLSRVTRHEIRYESVNLSDIVLASAAEVRKAWPGRQVKLSVMPGLVAVCDRNLLRIVIDNLMSNAWKFTTKQELAKIEFGEMPVNGIPTYFVRDNGAGFDMAYVDKLFGAFQRLHEREEYPGTGIGLATVQRIVVRHGGRVWAEGRVGGGATMFFTLGNGVNEGQDHIIGRRRSGRRGVDAPSLVSKPCREQDFRGA
jgi:PAS domain S-box-containing protein